MAEHHGGRAAAAQGVPLAADLQPVGRPRPCSGLTSRRTRSTRISAPPPGRLPKPGRLQPHEHLADRQPGELAMWSISGGLNPWTLTCGKLGLDVAEQLLVPLERQLRVHAALQAGSGRRPGRSSRRSSRSSVVAVDDVGVRVAEPARERAEAAAARADVRVVDVAVDVVGAIRLGVQPPRDGVGRLGPARPGRATPAAAAPRPAPSRRPATARSRIGRT